MSLPRQAPAASPRSETPPAGRTILGVQYAATRSLRIEKDPITGRDVEVPAPAARGRPRVVAPRPPRRAGPRPPRLNRPTPRRSPPTMHAISAAAIAAIRAKVDDWSPDERLLPRRRARARAVYANPEDRRAQVGDRALHRDRRVRGPSRRPRSPPKLVGVAIPAPTSATSLRKANDRPGSGSSYAGLLAKAGVIMLAADYAAVMAVLKATTPTRRGGPGSWAAAASAGRSTCPTSPPRGQEDNVAVTKGSNT